jgi:hypothetical protein
MYYVVFSILKINVIPCFFSWTDSTFSFLVSDSTLEVVVFTSGPFPRYVRPVRFSAGPRPGLGLLAVIVTTPCSIRVVLFSSDTLPACIRFSTRFPWISSHAIPALPGPARTLPGPLPDHRRSSMMYPIQAALCCYAFSELALFSRSAS